MKRSKHLLIGALAAGAAALAITPAIAFADDNANRPLLTTTCTYEQVTAALRAEAPKAAERLDDHPKAAERLRKILALTPAERTEKFETFKKNHPKAAEHRADRPKARAALQKALEKCGSY